MELNFVNPFKRGISKFVAERFEEIFRKATSDMKFVATLRTLFYVARELAMKETGEFFKDYNSFTQDFFVSFRKVQSPEMRSLLERYIVAEPRGTWINPSIEDPIELGNRFRKVGDKIVEVEYGIELKKANKVIVVEKQGLFRAMVINDFHKRLDAVLVCTQGFIIEKGKIAIQEIAERYKGLPIIVLHDYDVNGILIRETLYKPTKRRDWLALNDVKIIDIGLNWDVVRRFNLHLRAEPVRLKQQDLGKLEYLYRNKVITKEEYEFLKHYRVELNALTQEQLLQWLEEELERMGLGKYRPTQKEIDEKTEELWREKFPTYSKWIIEEKTRDILNEALNGIYDILKELENLVQQQIADSLTPPPPPKITTQEFYKTLEERKTVWWEDLLEDLITSKAWEVGDNIETEIEKRKEEIKSILKKEEGIRNLLQKLRDVIISAI